MVEGGMRRGDSVKVLGLPTNTCHDWRKAFRERGIRGLVPKSNRPRRVCRPQWTAAHRRKVETEIRSKLAAAA